VKRTFVAVALAVVFVLALAAPALALTHTAQYEMGGVVNFKKQAGHFCNTGAEIKQTIMGSGVMDKVQTVAMVSGMITMDDTNNWVAGATPLTVTTVWNLCMPPKAVYESDDYRDTDIGWKPYYSLYKGLGKFKEFNQGVTTAGTFPTLGSGSGYMSAWDVLDDLPSTKGLTDQVWAVQVQADPGFSGNLKQVGTAAHGNGVTPLTTEGEIDDKTFGSDDEAYYWFWGEDAKGNGVRKPGPSYVGMYFNMDQHARTSQGTLKRYIDISSPFSGAYLHEDMSVVGKSDVKDAFSLVNVPAGEDVPGAWWKLF
jgi:hypothetical protein